MKFLRSEELNRRYCFFPEGKILSNAEQKAILKNGGLYLAETEGPNAKKIYVFMERNKEDVSVARKKDMYADRAMAKEHADFSTLVLDILKFDPETLYNPMTIHLPSMPQNAFLGDAPLGFDARDKEEFCVFLSYIQVYNEIYEGCNPNVYYACPNEFTFVLYGYEVEEGGPVYKKMKKSGIKFRTARELDILSRFIKHFEDKESEHATGEEDDIFVKEIGKEDDDKNRKLTAADTRKSIKLWLLTHDYPTFHNAIESRVLGQENLKVLTSAVYNYLECVANGRTTGTRVLLTAPSGCGKTETFRAIQEYLFNTLEGMPVYQVDTSRITEEGFRGKSPDDILKPLARYRSGNDGIGIIFLDEFDKKLMPSFDAEGDDVNRHVQHQLLTIIEGMEYDVRLAHDEYATVNTSNTLFIAMGAFEDIRIKRREQKQGIGFNQVAKSSDWFQQINRDDMIDAGASIQLIGRFPLVVSYHALDDVTIGGIISKAVQKVSQSLGCDIVLSQDFQDELRESMNTEYGVRMLDSMIRENAFAEYTKLLSRNARKEDYIIKICKNGKTECIAKKETTASQIREDSKRKKIDEIFSEYLRK